MDYQRKKLEKIKKQIITIHQPQWEKENLICRTLLFDTKSKRGHGIYYSHHIPAKKYEKLALFPLIAVKNKKIKDYLDDVYGFQLDNYKNLEHVFTRINLKKLKNYPNIDGLTCNAHFVNYAAKSEANTIAKFFSQDVKNLNNKIRYISDERDICVGDSFFLGLYSSKEIHFGTELKLYYGPGFDFS